MNINDLLSDEDIEECIDGSSDIGMIREIITLSQNDEFVDVESFADVFSYKISGFIDTEEGTEEWIEANENNWAWGFSIAENINNLLMQGNRNDVT